jgi:tRNA (guanine-N7-)-methyltransferase
VSAAEADQQAAQMANLRFLFTNASINLPDWLAQLPPGLLVLVTLQFPDPWFKSRHHKRRVLQPPLLQALATAMAPGSQLFLQSDVLPLIEPMVALVEASGCFTRPAADPQPWRPTNPLPVASERERHVRARGLPVYRVLFDRNAQPPPPLHALEGKAEAPSKGAAHNPGQPPVEAL